jgi:hypothetical protein
LIIGVKTRGGIKEEIYGFYPTAGSGKGIVKGPGMLKAEYRCGPNDDCRAENQAKLRARLSEVKQSVNIPISLDDRRKIYDVIKQWDSKSLVGPDDKQVVPSSDAEYRIADNNCIDFVAAVAKSLGYPTPTRAKLQTPAEFIAALEPLVAQEEKVREAKRQEAESAKRADAADVKAKQAETRRIEAEEKAEAAEAERIRAEARARRAEKREAELRKKEKESIPAEWVFCNCPGAHSHLGKVVEGKRYHQVGIKCPEQ